MKIGYHLSTEEHAANDLVELGSTAEALGFDGLSVSDHFHPWGGEQQHSPFVWSVLGGLAHATDEIEIGTLVTCPILRMHPALVAHAAATTATMLPDRFFLGLGSGERLNEHVLGQHWPDAGQRQAMLAEAIEVIRELFTGNLTTHRGEHFTVENARLYDVPADPPPIHVAAAGTGGAELAGRCGDGLVGLTPDRELVEAFTDAAGERRPVMGMIHVCVDEDEEAAREVVRTWWTIAGTPPTLNTELALPEHFEGVADLVDDERLVRDIVLGSDPTDHVEALEAYADVGFDRVFVHQIGPDQDRLFDLYTREVLPALHERSAASTEDDEPSLPRFAGVI